MSFLDLVVVGVSLYTLHVITFDVAVILHCTTLRQIQASTGCTCRIHEGVLMANYTTMRCHSYVLWGTTGNTDGTINLWLLDPSSPLCARRPRDVKDAKAQTGQSPEIRACFVGILLMSGVADSSTMINS
jgi:hypothetical protein